MTAGARAVDAWTRRMVTIVSGAQREGFTTVQFNDGEIVTVRTTGLIPL